MGHRALTGSFYCIPTSPLLIKEQLKAKKGLFKPPEGYTTRAIAYDPNVAFPTAPVPRTTPVSSGGQSTRIGGDGGPLSLPTWVLIGLLSLLMLTRPRYRQMIFITGLVMIVGSFVGATASETCIFDSQCSDGGVPVTMLPGTIDTSLADPNQTSVLQACWWSRRALTSTARTR
jgi:hypothetical protein